MNITKQDAAARSDEGKRLFCQIFEDMIERDVCLLRRNALHGHEAFSCNGCRAGTVN